MIKPRASPVPDAVTRSYSLYIVLLILVAAAIRIGTANYSLWYDELASVEFAGQPLTRLWSAWMVRETNPPLFYSLLSGSISLFGHSDVALRLLPVSIGLLGIWAAYILGKAIGGPHTGLFAAALLSLSAQHTDFSQQVRAYGLAHTAVLFACIGMVLYLQRRSFVGLLLYASATIVALYAHTTLALFAAISAVTMLWLLRRDKHAVVRWLVTNSIVLAFWSWWAVISVRQMMSPVTNVSWIQQPLLHDAVGMTEIAYLPLYVYARGTISAVLLAGLLIGIGLCAFRTRRPELALLAILTFATPLCLFAISQKIPIFLPRTLSWASGPELTLVAFAVTRVPVSIVSKAVAGGLLCLSIVGLAAWMPVREREQWRQAVRTLERHPRVPVFVGDDAVALAIEKYRTVPRSNLDPIVVQSPRRERWAASLYRGPHMSAEAASRVIRDRGGAFIVGRGPFDPPILQGVPVKTIPLTANSAPDVKMVRVANAASALGTTSARSFREAGFTARLPNAVHKRIGRNGD